jgi:hypothetical protein
MPEQFRQIVKPIGSVQLTGVDQAHIEITHPAPFIVLLSPRCFGVDLHLQL